MALKNIGKNLQLKWLRIEVVSRSMSLNSNFLLVSSKKALSELTSDRAEQLFFITILLTFLIVLLSPFVKGISSCLARTFSLIACLH
ncbi:CLUMA_CG009034, isoform A [Clunio marinus]|uniref:CLUMA_CG009034, isoform A n=1 Tax=Clunio marinus TaxID=568069 RepID=A0A1J1I746_9DIPT|nr:CLUMA_CG009034, isoform A [Clunio marinus]